MKKEICILYPIISTVSSKQPIEHLDNSKHFTFLTSNCLNKLENEKKARLGSSDII